MFALLVVACNVAKSPTVPAGADDTGSGDTGSADSDTSAETGTDSGPADTAVPDTDDTAAGAETGDSGRTDTGASHLVIGATIASTTVGDFDWFHGLRDQWAFPSTSIGGAGSWLLADKRLVAVPASGTVDIAVSAAAILSDSPTVVGDFDGDGIDDAFMSWGEWVSFDDGVNYECRGHGGILLGPLSGAVARTDAASTIAGDAYNVGCPMQYGAFPGDVDGDGAADLVVADSDELRAVPLTGDVAWDDAALVVSEEAGSAVATGDLDGDGLADLGVLGTGGLRIFATPLTVPAAPGDADALLTGSSLAYASSAAGDVNGDGYDDLIAGALPVFVVYGPVVSGTVADVAGGEITDARLATGGDVDGDGLADVTVGWEERDVVESYVGPVLGTVALGDGAYSFFRSEANNYVGMPVTYVGSLGGPHVIAAGDNGADFVAANAGALFLLDLQ